MQLVWIASLFFALLIALFAVQNTMAVTVNLLVWRIEAVAVSALVLGAAALGALTTYLFGLSREIRGRLQQRGSRSTIRDQDTLIADLRTRVRELEQENDALRRGSGAGSQESGLGEASTPGTSRPPAALIDFPPSESEVVPGSAETRPADRPSP